jgi:hypothetical protein
MLLEWIVTILHGILCVVMVVGVIYSRTRIAQGAVLATLLLIFFGIRMFRGCAMDSWEICDDKPILADMGMALTIQDYKHTDIYTYEQIAVGNLVIIHLIQIFVQSVVPVERFFE